MRKRIINFLYKYSFLHWILWIFHRTIGHNHFHMGVKNWLDSSTANIYKDIFEVKEGTNNQIVIGKDTDLHHSRITFKGSDNKIIIGKNGFLNGVNIVIEGDHNQVIIGDHAFILDDTRIYVVDGSTFKMGNGCMLSDKIEVRTTDNHAIFDLTNMKRINPEENIIFHDKVWIGTGVTVLKGTEIAEGCVVGAASVITRKHLKPHAVIAGNPGREVRENVIWTMERGHTWKME